MLHYIMYSLMHYTAVLLENIFKIELFILISVILFLMIILLLIFLYLTPSHQMKIIGEKIPGPKRWPIVGNSLLFIRNDRFLQTIIELYKIYGPVFRLWIVKDLMIILENPDDIKVFLTGEKHLNKTDVYRYADFWLGNKNLLTADEHIWRNHRNLLRPTFHLNILESFLKTLQGNAGILCKQLEVRIDGEEFDILSYVEKCSLDIISETALGVKLETQKLNDTPYLDAVKNLTKVVIKRQTSPWLHNELIFSLMTSIGRKSYADAKYTKDFVRQIIKERKMNLEKGLKCSINKDGKVSQKQKKPFLDYMLLESSFSDEEIDNEVQTIMFAGHDTSTTTTAFCIYALSQHPDVQEKVYQEIRDLLKTNDREELGYEDYNKQLMYLDNVLKETMRMYPTVPIISRKVSEDILLPSGFTLPKGSLANFFIYQLHKDEKYFPNPDVFIPERFEKNEDIANFFIPFSAGPRNCIGQKFAMLEMKVIIAALVQKYKILPSEKVKTLIVETGAVLRSLTKHPIRLTLREHIMELDL